MPKYAFITGASRGIGAAIANELAAQGYHLYLTCLTNGQRLQSLADELSQTYSVSCQCFVGDIGDYSFVERCFAKINTLDVLVNNAGISYVGLLSDMEVRDWNQVMHTNLSASFYTSKLAIPLMLKKHEGKIINISSVSGILGNAGQSNYAASKAGVIGLTKSVARELASRGICVNAVAPGFVETEMTAVLPEKTQEELKKQIPLGRAGQVQDIANAVAFLASPESDYITGQVLSVDGGMAI